jgi:response regulator NasT
VTSLGLIQQGSKMQAGIENQHLIATTVGIVMAKSHYFQDIAFESLRGLARNQRRSLRDIAFELVDSTSSINAILTEIPEIQYTKKDAERT